MTTKYGFGPILGLAGVLALGACATPSRPPANTNNSGNTYQSVDQPRATYSGYGVIQSIETVQQDYQGVGGTGYGLGTLAGAVIGGAAGNQVGHGDGRKVATVAGAAGGAYVGHQLEKRNQPADVYVFTVRMEGGSHQTITLESTGDMRVGDRVRIDNGSMRRY
jgi:outer membrane lipoprotein SlyB